ncbi:hypothetical protein GCM10010885_16020 [Alicyclobacillus cellulosilyticus]|uniref:Secreted protein n=1 Tax=Alicyclobacillus cellulosilyticus TaxID=1003997 RepID=A0A917KBY5_9BACL|nr:hypothetical protein [Alicyclobacillus cellulosilyticus]GGJ07736.1 hypothetical protein GCM10010885_16020 [Alicyclobacillus cellulosilyticus]
MKRIVLGMVTVLALGGGANAIALADPPAAAASSTAPVPVAIPNPLLTLHLVPPPGALGDVKPAPKPAQPGDPPVVAGVVKDLQALFPRVTISALGNPKPAPAPWPAPSSWQNLDDTTAAASAASAQPAARGSVGPFNPGPVAPNGGDALLTIVTTVQGGISVGGNFAGGGFIVCVNQNNGNEYVGAVQSGTTSALNDYIPTPSGTYAVFIVNPTNTTQTYTNLTVYFN